VSEFPIHCVLLTSLPFGANFFHAHLHCNFLGILATRSWMSLGQSCPKLSALRNVNCNFFSKQSSICVHPTQCSYPLMFHILILLVTEGGLRIMMWLRGFRRLRVGPISYYYHPGKSKNSNTNECEDGENDEVDIVPIVFCHGIGIGLIFYLTLVDELLRLERPLLLPEISYVSGFRPWQSPNSVLPPAAVTSCLLSILACHGYARGAFLGHSYGTSYLSFMCKYAPRAVAAVLFLDPICFCLHCPR
jgi:hypothetical protein